MSGRVQNPLLPLPTWKAEMNYRRLGAWHVSMKTGQHCGGSTHDPGMPGWGVNWSVWRRNNRRVMAGGRGWELTLKPRWKGLEGCGGATVGDEGSRTTADARLSRRRNWALEKWRWRMKVSLLSDEVFQSTDRQGSVKGDERMREEKEKKYKMRNEKRALETILRTITIFLGF